MSVTRYDGGRYKGCMDALHPPGARTVWVSSCECPGLAKQLFSIQFSAPIAFGSL